MRYRSFLIAAVLFVGACDSSTDTSSVGDPTFAADSAAAVARGGLWPHELVLRAEARHIGARTTMVCSGPIHHVRESEYLVDVPLGPGYLEERHVNGPHSITTNGSDGTIFAEVYRDQGAGQFCKDPSLQITWDPFVAFPSYFSVVNQHLQDITIRAIAATNQWQRMGARVTIQPQTYDTTWSLIWSTNF
jgi:hypothetical protein